MFKGLAKSVLLYGIASGISSFIGIFLVPIYTKTFSPADYGILEVINTIIMIASIMGLLQLESAISRYYYEFENSNNLKLLISTAFWTFLFFSLFAAFILFILSGYLSIILFNDNNYSYLIKISVLLVPLGNLYSFFSIIIRFKKRPVLFMLFSSVQLITTVGFSIWYVVIKKSGIEGAYYARILGYLFVIITMYIYLKKILVFQWDWSICKKMFQYSLPLVPSTAGTWINSYASRLIILAYLSVKDVGLYSAAYKIASIFLLFEHAFRMAWGPYMWEKIRMEKHRDLFISIAKYLSMLVFGVVIIFSLFAKDILNLFTSKEYYEAGNLVGLIVLSLSLRTINQVIGIGPSVVNKTIYNTIINFISVGINIGSLFVFISSYGLISIPISLLMGSLSLNILSWYFSEKLYYIGFSKLIFIFLFFLTLIIVAFFSIVEIDLFHKIVLVILFIGIIFFFYRDKISLKRIKLI